VRVHFDHERRNLEHFLRRGIETPEQIFPRSSAPSGDTFPSKAPRPAAAGEIIARSGCRESSRHADPRGYIVQLVYIDGRLFHCGSGLLATRSSNPAVLRLAGRLDRDDVALTPQCAVLGSHDPSTSVNAWSAPTTERCRRPVRRRQRRPAVIIADKGDAPVAHPGCVRCEHGPALPLRTVQSGPGSPAEPLSGLPQVGRLDDLTRRAPYGLRPAGGDAPPAHPVSSLG